MISSSEKTPEPENQTNKPLDSAFQKFEEAFSQLATPEEKIAFGLKFMRGSISQEGSPHFRHFWEARKHVLTHFKENLNPLIRSSLWSEYVELTREARKLKEVLEEQSAFAVEQIELAIKALESDVENFEALLSKQSEILFPEESKTIRHRQNVYSLIQKELNLLSTLATRLNSLRKEVMKTEMRLRIKSRLFRQLSQLGDHVFPKRKELIEKVSEEFEKDVLEFVEKHFSDEAIVGAPYYALKEEIKALQAIAKRLTLSSPSFTKTRMLLSKCWDRIRGVEQEYRKEHQEKKQQSADTREEFLQRIGDLKEKELSFDEIKKECYSLLEEMRGVFLVREDVRLLKEAIEDLKNPYLEEERKAALEREEEAKRLQEKKREAKKLFKERLQAFSKEADSMELEALQEACSVLKKEAEALGLSKMEKQLVDRTLRPIKDLVADRKEEALLNLSDDDKKALQNLKSVLEQKKQRRQEIKEILDTYRKVLGSSDLDFEKAMHYQDLVQHEKQRLEKANLGIEEIEQKIDELEG